jgi:hypothetical protein
MLRLQFTRDLSCIRFSEPLAPPMKLLSFCSSLLSLCLFPAFQKEISRQDRLETTIGNSVDPLHPRFCSSSGAFPFPKVDRCRHRIGSKKILAQNAKAASNWRRRRPCGGQNRPFIGVFSATQPHKGNRIIVSYGAGDGNRTNVRSLGS